MGLYAHFKHYLHARPRLAFATLAGLICFALLPRELSTLSRGVLSWNVLAWIYLISLWWLMLHADPMRIRQIARIQDESASTVLMMVSLASVMSLVVIFLELSTTKQLSGLIKIRHIGLTASTLIASWLLVPTAFALHYAHLFYRSNTPKKPLLFPEQLDEPGYWDFLYFSFTIGVASQTADVAVGNTQVRRIVLLQSILSFIFNMSILGLSINVGASLLT